MSISPKMLFCGLYKNLIFVENFIKLNDKSIFPFYLFSNKVRMYGLLYEY